MMNVRLSPLNPFLTAPAAVSGLTEDVLPQRMPFPSVFGTHFIAYLLVRGQFKLTHHLFQASALFRHVRVELWMLVDVTDGNEGQTDDDERDRLLTVCPDTVIDALSPAVSRSHIEAIRDVVLFVVLSAWQLRIAIAMGGSEHSPPYKGVRLAKRSGAADSTVVHPPPNEIVVDILNHAGINIRLKSVFDAFGHFPPEFIHRVVGRGDECCALVFADVETEEVKASFYFRDQRFLC